MGNKLPPGFCVKVRERERLTPLLSVGYVVPDARSQRGAFETQRKAEYKACFQRELSMVQQTLALMPRFRTGDQTARLRSLPATLRRSTTVMPRVNSLEVSTSTKCSLCCVTIVGSSAMDIATGPANEMPFSPVSSKWSS